MLVIILEMSLRQFFHTVNDFLNFSFYLQAARKKFFSFKMSLFVLQSFLSMVLKGEKCNAHEKNTSQKNIKITDKYFVFIFKTSNPHVFIAFCSNEKSLDIKFFLWT